MRREETWVHGGTVSTEKCGLGPKSEWQLGEYRNSVLPDSSEMT